VDRRPNMAALLMVRFFNQMFFSEILRHALR
jgi:hypothetical protein